MLNVTSDFIVNDSILVSGLSFANFTAASVPDNLEIEVDNAGTVAGTDPSTIAIGAPTFTSAGDQVFGTGDPSTPMAMITVTEDATTPRILAGTDLRIRIPAGFNMTWDATDVTATFGGTASGRVTNPVSYEDGDRTLVIDVTSDFTPGSTLTISDLSFASFTGESPADTLELEVNNLNTAAFLDPQTVLVSNRPTIVGAVTGDTSQNGSIDQLIVTFSEDLNGSSTSVQLGVGFTVAGYVIGLGSETAPGIVTFVLVETGLPDTGATPSISYDPSAGDLDDLVGLEMNAVAGVVAADGAPPRIVDVVANDTDQDGFLNEVVFTYSETLGAGQEDVDDWRMVDADGVTNLLAGLTDLDLTIAADTLTINLPDTAGTAGSPIFLYMENGGGGAMSDGAGNTAPDQTNNSTPLADAGPDQSVGPTVFTLDGSGSMDPDGQPLTYAWLQIGGPLVALNGAATETPSFTAFQPATYTFQLTVDDNFATDVDTVSITIVNVPPTADAGFDQTVLSGGIVVLDGTRSLDVNADALTFAWTQISGPGVLLANPASPTPNFNPVLNAVLEFELVVTDTAANTDADTVRITVNDLGNGVPTANAGANRASPLGAVVSLDGGLSTDPDGDPLTYSWTPAGLLTGAATRTPTFTPVTAGLYTLQLTVTDSSGVDSAPDSVLVLVHDPDKPPPEAVAVRLAPASDPVVGDLVILDGKGSLTVAGVNVQYAWFQLAGPRVSLSNPSAAEPSFVPILSGTYSFDLVVTEGGQQSLPVRFKVPVLATVGDPLPVADVIIDPLDDPDGDGRVSSATAPIVLDGSVSTGIGLSFAWVQMRGPTTILSAPTGPITGFTPVQAGIYSFRLTVIDANGVRDAFDIEILVDTATNLAPTANAGPDAAGTAGEPVILDGSASFDPAADADGVTGFGTGLLAFWSQTAGFPVALSDPTAVNPEFTPPAAGIYTFELRVSDGLSESFGDSVTITVAAAPVVGGGGGGSCGVTGWEVLALLGLIRWSRRRRRHVE